MDFIKYDQHAVLEIVAPNEILFLVVSPLAVLSFAGSQLFVVDRPHEFHMEHLRGQSPVAPDLNRASDEEFHPENRSGRGSGESFAGARVTCVQRFPISMNR